MFNEQSWILSIRSPHLTQFFQLFPYLASYYFIFMFLAIFYWSSSGKNKTYALDLGFMIILSTIINRILKLAFAVSRPTIERLVIINDNSHSFPSGDAQVLTLFWLMMAYFYGKQLIWLLAILMIILVDCSRVYLGAHFTIDVIAGTIIGYSVFLVYIKFLNNKLASRIKHSNALLQLLVITFTCMIYYLILQKSLISLDIIVMGTLFGLWSGFLILPKSVCYKSLNIFTLIIAFIALIGIVILVKFLLKNFSSSFNFQFICYWFLAFYVSYLAPMVLFRLQKI